jgi:hypothetical protein
MESITSLKNLWKQLQDRWSPPPAPPPLAAPAQASAEAIHTARTLVEAASASIANAYGKWATAFAIVHEGEALLVTSAHLTNNRVMASTGFDYKGKKLFPVIRGTSLAFAEHIAVNPQGSVCAFSGNIDFDKPFREISILRLLPPEETRTALYELSFGADSQTRLNHTISLYPSLAGQRLQNPPSKEALMRLTSGFSLLPIHLAPTTSAIGSTPAYSIGYFNNQAHHVASHAGDMEGKPHAFSAKFTCDQPIVGGHSGSLLFTVTPQGGIKPLGIVNAASGKDLMAYGTKFSEVMEGIKTVIAEKTIHQSASLDKICAQLPGISAWYAPNAIEASIAPRPANIPAQIQATTPKCAAR